MSRAEARGALLEAVRVREAMDRMTDPNDVNVEWEWSDGRPMPTKVYTDSAMSQHMGDLFISLEQTGKRLGVFVTAEQWDEIDKAARRAIEHRRALTEAGWT